MDENKLIITIILSVTILVIGGIYVADRIGVFPSDGQVSSKSLESLVNNPVPQFLLKDKNGTEYSSENLKGKKVVLFFNEGIMCYPGCWNQVASLGTDGRFQSPDIAALSVVIDSPDDWQKAIKEMPELAKATLVFDRDKSVSKKFNMLTAPSSMHSGSMPGHTYILVDKEGIVRYVYDDPNMGINNDLLFSELEKMK